MKTCFGEGGLLLKIPVIVAHTCGCSHIPFHDMLKWLTYERLWVSTPFI